MDNLWTPRPCFLPLMHGKKIVGSFPFYYGYALDVYTACPQVYDDLAPDVTAVENLKGVSQVKSTFF